MEQASRPFEGEVYFLMLGSIINLKHGRVFCKKEQVGLRRCRSFGEKKPYKGDSGWDLYPKRPLAGASIYICLHRVLSTGNKANREWHRKKCVRIFKETSDKSV